MLRFLTTEVKENHVVACQTLLDHYERESTIVTADESWVLYLTLAKKGAAYRFPKAKESPCVVICAKGDSDDLLGQKGCACWDINYGIQKPNGEQHTYIILRWTFSIGSKVCFCNFSSFRNWFNCCSI